MRVKHSATRKSRPEHVEQSVNRWLKQRADERAMCKDFTNMKGGVR